MEINKKTLRSIFLGAAACIILYWLLHETERSKAVWLAVSNVLSPFITGAAIAFVLNVPMRALERPLRKIKKAGLRRAISIVMTLLAVALVLTGVIYLLVPQMIITIESLIDTIPGFFTRVQAYVTDFLNNNPQLLAWLQANTDIESFNWQSLIEKVVAVLSNGVTTAVDMVRDAVVGLSAGIFNAVLSFVFAIYCLSRKEILARQGRMLVYSALPEKSGDEVVRVLRMTNSSFSNFISGQCLEALILGALFAVFMLIFNMPYVPLISVIIAVTALVPIVGAFVGCIVGAFFILMVDPQLAFWFVIMFLILQQLENNLIYPRVVGSSIGLPGMWVLLAVAIGGDLMGIGGMLLMIPLAAVVYTLLREFADKQLEKRRIPKEKLMDQPPVLKSGYQQKHERKLAKRAQKRKEVWAQMQAEVAQKQAEKLTKNDNENQ